MRKGKDPHYNACRQLFDDLHGRKRTVAVSALVVGEVIQVTRREAAREAGKEYVSNAARLRAARNTANEGVDAIFQHMWRLYDTGRIALGRPSKSAGQHPGIALNMLIRHRGHFEPHGKMGTIHRNLGMFDIMHALTAHGYGVRDFCTTDRQFSALAGDPRFPTMNFVIL